MGRHSNKIIFTLGIIITLFFNIWKINEFPQDLNPEVIIGADALRCLERAHIERIRPQTCFRQLSNRWETRGLTFRNYDAALVHKLWLLIVSIFFNIFGYSIFSIVLSSSIVGIIAIFFTYKLGKLLYSEAVGILAGISLTTSIAYNMTVRSGYGFVVVTTVSLIIYYYLYRYLKTGIRRYLIITGILLGIGSLDAPPQFFLLPASIIPILLFSFSKKQKGKLKNLIYSLKDIIIVFLLAVITSLVFTVLYAWYYNTTIFSVYNEIYFWINQKLQGVQSTHTHQYSSRNIKEALQYAALFIKNIFIGMSPYELDDYALLLKEVPMLTPLISIFFVVGLLSMFILPKNKIQSKSKMISLEAFTDNAKANRLLLIWLSINFIVYMFLIRVQTRYVEIFLPGICIIGAFGIVTIVNKINFNKYTNIIKQSVYMLIILIISYIGYRNFFVSYKNNDANLRRFYNNSKIAGFIVKNSKPEDCLVVLAENLFSCRDAVVFNMQYKPYKVLYLEEILYEKAQGSDNKRQITLEEAKEAIWELESEALKGNKTVYYVFSEHSIDYYFSAMVPKELYPYVNMFKDIFFSLHPATKPVEILKYSNGDPTHSIFMVRE